MTWTGNGGVSDPYWDSPANWSPAVPTSGDTAVIGATFDPSFRATSGTVSIGQLRDSGSLTVTGGSLSTSAASNISAALNMSGGTLGGSGPMSIGGASTAASTLTGGTLGTLAASAFTFNGALAITGQAPKNFANGTVTMAGNTTWAGNISANGNAIQLGGSGSTTLNNTGTWSDQNTFAAQVGQTNGSQFNNEGAYTKSGAAVTTFNTAFNNFGSVNVNAGTLSLADGGTSTGFFTVENGATLQLAGGTHQLQGIVVVGPGVFQMSGGTALQTGTTSETGPLNIVGGELEVKGSWTAPSYSMSGGRLGGAGTTTISGAATWSSGLIGDTGSGVDNFEGILSISGQAQKYVGAGTLTSSGITTWSGNTGANGNVIQLGLYHPATVNNTGAWLDENTFASQIVQTYASQFNNGGTYTKYGAAVTTISSGFNNTGSVNVKAGTLSLAGGGTSTGSFTVANGATLQLAGGTHQLQGITVGGPGVLQISGGTAQQSGTTNETGPLNIVGGDLEVQGNWTAASFSMSGGQLGGGGTTTIGGAATWSAGVIGDSGNAIFKGALSISGQAQKIIGGTSFNTAGTTTWSGNTSAYSNTIQLADYSFVNVNNTGTWLDANTFDTQLASGNEGGQFNNLNTYTKSGKSNTFVYGDFNNAGVVNVDAGQLNLVYGGSSTGRFNIASGATLKLASVDPRTEPENPPLVLQGVTFGGPGVLEIGGGTVQQSGATTEAGQLNFTSGDLEVQGTWTAASFSMSSYYAQLGGPGTTTILGAATWTAGFIGDTVTGVTNFKGALSLTGADVKWISGGTFNTFGTTTWSGNTYAGGNNLYLGSFQEFSVLSATVNNAGTWLDENTFAAQVSQSTGSQFNNEGTYTKSGAAVTTFNMPFSNSGTVNVNAGTLTFASGLVNFSGTTLTSGTYNVGTTLEFAGANIVTNDANIVLKSSSAQILNSTNATNALANFAVNAGSFSIAGGRNFTSSGSFTNLGALSIGTGSTFSVASSGTFTQSAGKTTDDGTLSAAKGVTLSSGTLQGVGSIAGNVASSGIVAPGDSATTTGVLTDVGTYAQNSTGSLNISIGGTVAGTKYDQLNATSVRLGGTLGLQLVNGYVPTVGSTYKILNYGAETGQFANVNGLAINSSEHFAISYTGTDVLLTAVSGALLTRMPPPVPARFQLDRGFLAGVAPNVSLARDVGSQTRPSVQIPWRTVSPSASIRVESARVNAAEARLRSPKRVRSANLQLSFGSLFSRPAFSVGVN